MKWLPAGQALLMMELHSLVRYPGDVVKVDYLGRQGFAAICAGPRSHSQLVCLISTGAMTDERCFELLSKFTCKEKYSRLDLKRQINNPILIIQFKTIFSQISEEMLSQMSFPNEHQ